MITRKFSTIIAFFVVIGSANIAVGFGNDEHWVSGFGQGTKEALIKKGAGNEIYVACEAGSLSASSIRFTLAGRAPTGSSVTLTFDGLDPEPVSIWDGMIPSNCRACAANFTFVIERLKRHSSVHVLFENGDGARFSLAGSAEAIGECRPGF